MDRNSPESCEIGNKPLNRDVIKYIAVVCMTFNHTAFAGFVPYGSPLWELFVNIGYVTAVTMCFFLVEGWHHTRDRIQYLLRMAGFALLSQIPYRKALGAENGNMLVTLLLCLLILWVMEYVRPAEPGQAGLAKTLTFALLRAGLVCLFAALTIHCDWPLVAPVAVVLFEKGRGSRAGQVFAYLTAAAMLWTLAYVKFSRWAYPPEEAALHALYAVIPCAVSAVLTLGLYNGKMFRTHRAFHRWFFYLYYPAHLTVLWALKSILLT